MAANPAELTFDEAFDRCSSNEWHLTALAEPRTNIVDEEWALMLPQGISPIAIKDFLSVSSRELGLVKTTRALFDFNANVPDAQIEFADLLTFVKAQAYVS